jgi:HPt (histidine-containing phosphotransfer) domain-containing protein
MGKMILSFNASSKVHDTMAWQPALGLSRLDHDEVLMGEIIALLETALREHVSDVNMRANSNDFNSLRRLTHSQLPSLKILGFDQQTKVFEAFESAVVMSDELACRRLSPMVQKIWMTTLESLSRHQRTVAP